MQPRAMPRMTMCDSSVLVLRGSWICVDHWSFSLYGYDLCGVFGEIRWAISNDRKDLEMEMMEVKYMHVVYMSMIMVVAYIYVVVRDDYYFGFCRELIMWIMEIQRTELISCLQLFLF